MGVAQHPALAAGRVAVITGAASGIGLAAAERFAGLGMKLCLADYTADALDQAAAKAAELTANGADDVIFKVVDVRRDEELAALRDLAYDHFGEVGVLMNNAGVEPPSKALEASDTWQQIIETNLWGVVNGTQAFAPAMIAQGTPCAIINTGSKQGITCPPGNAAYNVSKAGVKVFTEQLAHELRNGDGRNITAHLLIPGFTFTGFTRVHTQVKPDGAWAPEQVIDFMVDGMGKGDFYILCPDNDVTRAMDEKRMAWAIGDVIENRPPLSRWHPGYEQAFKDYMAE